MKEKALHLAKTLWIIHGVIKPLIDRTAEGALLCKEIARGNGNSEKLREFYKGYGEKSRRLLLRDRRRLRSYIPSTQSSPTTYTSMNTTTSKHRSNYWTLYIPSKQRKNPTSRIPNPSHSFSRKIPCCLLVLIYYGLVAGGEDRRK